MLDSVSPNAFDVRPHLQLFARTISHEPLGLALYRPETWAIPTRCFENTAHQVEQAGGSALFGWMFHYRVVVDIPGPGYLTAVHHAVWHAPTGNLVDVTPLHDNPLHRPISQGGNVLFLVDTNAKPIAVERKVGPRPSKFYAMDNGDERLVAYVQRMTDAENRACRNLYMSDD